MAGRSSTVDVVSAEASGYLLDADLIVSSDSRRVVTEAQWSSLQPTGSLQKDLLNFYELEYKYNKVAYAPDDPRQTQGVLHMFPRRRELVLERMRNQAEALGAAIAKAMLPTFDSWVRAHDLEHLDVMGAERMKNLQKRYHAEGKMSNIYDWVLKQRTTGVSLGVVTAKEWLNAVASDKASSLRFALELLHEAEYADQGDFDRFVRNVVARDPIGTMRRAIQQVDLGEQEAVVLQMFQTVYPIGYRKRLGATSAKVGRNIIAAQSILEDVQNRHVSVPELFAKVNWTLNVVHQAGKMADHVAKDMGISVEYLNKLSNIDTSAWDAELEAMSRPGPRESVGVGEAIDDDPIDWVDDRDYSFDWDAWFDRQAAAMGGRARGGRWKKLKPRPDFHADWAIPRKLARTSRPGYPTRTTVPLEKVDKWIAGAQKAGIKSIIVLLGPDQLGMYKDVPGGLVNYYRKNGFKVAHVPTVDKHRIFIKAKTEVPKGTKWLEEPDLEAAYEAYRRLPKPVLVHCSAGIDRSGAVVRYIKDEEGYKGKDPLGRIVREELESLSAGASVYLLEQFSQYEYKIPEDKETQLYDFYMYTFLPAPSQLEEFDVMYGEMGTTMRGVRRGRPDLAYAVSSVNKLIPYMKTNLLNAAFYSIACEVRYIFSKTGGTPEEIIEKAGKKFGQDMAIRVANYWKEYRHFTKYPVAKGKSFEVPGVVSEVLGGDSNSDRDASYRAALKAFEGKVQDFIRFASWGFWDRPWSGFHKAAYIEAQKDKNKQGMKSASGSYGGGNWGSIADAWLKLWGAKGLSNDVIYIDVLYSIQHNTGVMLNKVKSYSKNGRYGWITRALDKKFGAESPYEFAKRVSPGMRRLAMAVMKYYYDTTLEQWVKDNPTKVAADATKAGKSGGGYGDGAKKDYVRTKSYSTRPPMKKSLIKWFKDVTPENVDGIFAAAEKKHGFGVMKVWQFPVHTVSKTQVKSSPPMVQGQDMPLVQVLSGVLGTTSKHQYFDKKKPGTSWMSAKHLGIKQELTHFRKATAAPPKPAAPPPKPKVTTKPKVSPGLQVPLPSAITKMGFPEPAGPPVDVSGVKDAIHKSTASPIDDVYVEVQQPDSKIPAIKGIRQTYQMGLKDAKSVVDFSDKKNIAPLDMVGAKDAYLKFWWPKGNFVTLGDDVTQHPQAHWGQAQIAYARFSEGKWVFMRSDDPVKMIRAGNRWYVPATRIMDQSAIEGSAADAPKLGAQMAQVAKLAAGEKMEMTQLLQETFKVPHDDAVKAVDAIPTAKLADIGWPNYSPGTSAFSPDKFITQAPANVAIWSDAAKAVVPVEMAAWRITAHDIAYEFFVMDDAIKAATKAVAEAPVKPVIVHEGKTMYTVHDHGFGNAKLFGPSGDAGEVWAKAVELGKEYPNAGVNEFIYLDGQWQLLRQYNRAWKVLNTNDSVMNKIKAKTGGKPAAPTAVEPSPKPEDVGVHFKIRAEDPDTKEMKYAFKNEFISWNQVEKAVAMLQDPESGAGGAPFSDVAITIEKWAHPKAWPEGVEGKTEPVLVETMKPVPSKTEKGKYTALITFVDREWEKVGNATSPTEGPFPKDRAQAIAVAKKKGEPAAREPINNPAVTFTVKAKSGKALPPVKFLPVFVNAFTHWGQVQQALKVVKDPESGISGAPIDDKNIMIEKWAYPIAWSPSVDISKYRLDTSKPIKVGQLEVSGTSTWSHPAWTDVASGMQHMGPWKVGNMPTFYEDAVEWAKLAASMQEEPEEDVLPPEQITMTVADALMLPDLNYETSVALKLYPDDASLADVWNDLSIDNQSDIQVAIGKESAEALEKKRADIYKVYPTVRDDVNYKVMISGGSPPQLVGGKTPEKAMSVAASEVEKQKKHVTIVKEVWPSMNESYDLHTFESDGSLIEKDKDWVDPSMSKSKYTGIKHGVPHKFVFVDVNDEQTDLESPSFLTALEQANAIEAELPGDEYGNMYLWIEKSVFFKITGRLIEGDDIHPVEYGLPEGYVKDVHKAWAAATGLSKEPSGEKVKVTEPGVDVDIDDWTAAQVLELLDVDESTRGNIQVITSGNATKFKMSQVWDGLSYEDKSSIFKAYKDWVNKVKPKPTPEMELWADLDDMLVGNVLDSLSLSDEAREDLFQNTQSGDTMAAVWDSVTDHTKTEVTNAWKKYHKTAMAPLGEKPWNAWTVQEAIQLPISDEAKNELKNLGGGMVLGEVTILQKIRDEIITAINKWSEAQKKPKEEPKKREVEEPTLDSPIADLTLSQVIKFLNVSEDTRDKLSALQGAMVPPHQQIVDNVWDELSANEQADIMSAHSDWKIEKMKVPQEKPEEPEDLKVYFIPSEELGAMHPAGVIAKLPLEMRTIGELQSLLAFDDLHSAWNGLSDDAKKNILQSWKETEGGQIAKAKLKKKAPKKAPSKIAKKDEAKTAMKNWSVQDVISTLDLHPVTVNKLKTLMYPKNLASTKIMDVWLELGQNDKSDIVQSYHIAWDKAQGKQPTEKKAPKKAKKKKVSKKPTEAQAMKALQSWTIADAIKYLPLGFYTAGALPKLTDEPKKASVMSVWSMLGVIHQEKIIDAWKVHKELQQEKPKKPKKGKKAPTYVQAAKNLKTWKVASVFGFLDPGVHDYVHAAAATTGKTGPQVPMAELWDAITAVGKTKLAAAYIEFMKKQHGLESAAAAARGYLAEDEDEAGSFPRIVLRKDYGAAGGRDLYFVKWRANGRRYCYALGVAIRADIERIEDFSPAKAASIVKARSSGEYDCKTGELKHVEPKPKKMRKRRRQKKVEPPSGPAQVQTTLFGESVEASMYVLGEAVIVDTVYRSDLSPILEAADDPDAAAVAIEIPRRGMHPQDKKVRTELQSSKYPATAEKDKAFVFHWADGRGICAFKHKKDAVAWINDDVNSPNGPEIVKWWYGDPYTKQYDNRQKGKKKRKRLRVATSYTPVKPKKKTESVTEGATFVGRCVELEGCDIEELVEGSRSISNRTFRRLIGPENYRQLEEMLGYDKNLRMANDWAVSYGYGTYKGQSAAYVDWSAIEHVFVLDQPARVRAMRRTEAARKRRAPATYMSIGHRTQNRQAWYMARGSDDVTYGELGSTHAKLGKDFSHADVFGRVDHDSKRVSIWDSGTGRSDYAITILRMDFPGYEIWLSRAGQALVRVYAPVTEDEDVDVTKEVLLAFANELTAVCRDEDSEFARLGGSATICTNTARAAVNKFGGVVVGYHSEDNPTAVVGKTEGGHDFALIQDRFIFDWWTPGVMGHGQFVLDLRDPVDAALAKESYGDRSAWKSVERKTEDVDRDVEADRMLDRYREEPTSIWLYTDMPVKDRVAWAYLAADRFKGVEGEDLVERFIETLHQVVDDPETFWQQIRDRSPVRANYLDHLDWDIETVALKDVGVYPRFSGFSSEVSQGSVLDTAEAIETTGELPEKVAKLREMSDVWMTILKFLPPILVPGGILRSEERGYDVLKWTCDDGNHRLVSAAMAGATEAVCFAGTQKKEKIEPARLIVAEPAESVSKARRFPRIMAAMELEQEVLQ